MEDQLTRTMAAFLAPLGAKAEDASLVGGSSRLPEACERKEGLKKWRRTAPWRRNRTGKRFSAAFSLPIGPKSW
eukprot:scaffold5198_cov247-Pinguiococcus_pyrenoidosus.AAC.3